MGFYGGYALRGEIFVNGFRLFVTIYGAMRQQNGM